MESNHTNSLPLRIHDDKNGLDYTLHGDYYLPELEVPETPPLGHWGRMALDELKKRHPGRFARMLLDGTLYPYCLGIEQQAQERYDVLMQGYMRCWCITEELKKRDQMKWVGLISNARYEAEQHIFTNIIII